MSDSDLFAKLNRILETHNLSNNGEEEDFDSNSFLERLSFGISAADDPSEKSPASPDKSRHPRPFDVWKAKQKQDIKTLSNKQMNSEEWDNLVSHLYNSHKLRESAVMKEQNQGLAAEFSGHQFKPHMNKKSQELVASNRESLHQRVPTIMKEREDALNKTREEKAKKEMEECTFRPNRIGERTSDKYLKNLGREVNQNGVVDPEYFFRYHEEKLRRNAIRQQIVSEVASRELTFKPASNPKSLKMQEKLNKARTLAKQSIKSISAAPDPDKAADVADITVHLEQSPLLSTHQPYSTLTKTSTHKILQQPLKLLSVAGRGDPTEGDYFGTPVVVESSHPYKNNTEEFTTVNVPGAISYTVYFDEQTRTEPIYTYVKFFVDDKHIEYYGSGKYSGGMKVPGIPGVTTDDKFTNCNWPGVGGRPYLIINAARFVVGFKANGAYNDWGFKLYAKPLISNAQGVSSADSEDLTPTISARGKHFHGGSMSSHYSKSVHERLHYNAVAKATVLHSKQAELLQSKLKMDFKPWELSRSVKSPDQSASKKIPWSQRALKMNSNCDFADLVVGSCEKDENIQQGNENEPVETNVALLEFCDSTLLLWKALRQAQPIIDDASGVLKGL